MGRSFAASSGWEMARLISNVDRSSSQDTILEGGICWHYHLNNLLLYPWTLWTFEPLTALELRPFGTCYNAHYYQSDDGRRGRSNKTQYLHAQDYPSWKLPMQASESRCALMQHSIVRRWAGTWDETLPTMH